MSVFNPNRSEFNDCIASLLEQSYTNFELILINDGFDRVFFEEMDILKEFDFIKIINLDKNVGLAAALNIGIKESSGSLIARLDADDICYPTRFEEQVRFLEENPDVDLVGSWARCIGASNRVIKTLPDNDRIFINAIFDSPMVHPSVLGKREVFDQLYNNEFQKAQDYELWSRSLLSGYKFSNIQKPLIYYRLRSKSNSSFDQKKYSELVRNYFVNNLDFFPEADKRNLLKLANRHLVKEKISTFSILRLIFVLNNIFNRPFYISYLLFGNFIKLHLKRNR